MNFDEIDWSKEEWDGQDWDDSRLGDYLAYDCWTPHIGLCSITGFDYLASEKGDHSAPARFGFASALSPSAFMNSDEKDQESADSLLIKMNEDLDRLRGLWENSGKDIKAEDHTPRFYIEWASKKGFPPDWLGWAIERKLYVPKQEADEIASSGMGRGSLSYLPELSEGLQADSEGTVTQPDSTKGIVPDPMHLPVLAGPRFSMTKAAMIEQHQHEWPTVAQDIKDAVRNGLSEAAKASARGWREADAMEWARTKGKLSGIDKSGNAIAGANSIFNSPTSHRHASKD